MIETLSSEIPDDLQAALERLLAGACDRELRIAAAESCTGGLLASLLTDVEGCSHAFERGFVTYTDDAKREMLGVGQDLLDGPGAVSEAVARAMAEGALARSRADLAVSVTGYAGPSGDGGEEGLVHFAVAREGRPTAHREARFGAIGRGPIRVACVGVAVEMLEEALG